MRKKLIFAVLVLLMICGFSLTAGAEGQGSLTLGNLPEIIMNGGRMVSDEAGTIYTSDTPDGRLYVYEDGTAALLSGDQASWLNLIEDRLYYTVSVGSETVVRERNLTDGTSSDLYRTGEEIRQLYVSSDQTLYYLSSGRICRYDLAEKTLEREQLKGTVKAFIPLETGYIYSQGAFPRADVYYNGKLLAEEVSSYYLSDGHLIFVSGGDTFQAELDALAAAGDPASAAEPYDEGDYADPATALQGTDEEQCPYCEAAAADVSWVEEETAGSLQAYSSAGTVSGFDSATERQQNIVKRARQMAEVSWTPLQDISGWDNAYTFKKGTSYTGLPYGQPIDGVFVPWGTTLTGFVKAVNDLQSKMYTSYSDYNTSIAPYYSSDCSSFVSWAWNLNGRRTTRSLPTYSDKVASQSVYSAQLGDSFIAYGIHAVMVSDVGYDSEGEVVYIEITESTPPKTKVTRYGEGGSETLADLQKKYLEDGYILYRLKKQYSVSYTHDCAVPIDGDYCEDCAALTKPVISAVEQTGDGALKLSWDKVEYADAYGILRSDDSGSGFAWVGTAWELSYTDEDVRAGDTYQYQVFPMRYINGVWVSGPHSDTTELPCMEAPEKPTITASADALTISWPAVENAGAYGIVRAEAPEGPYVWLGSVGTTSYTDETAEPETVYYYKVYAAHATDKGWLNSAYSEAKAAITVLPPVRNVQTEPGAGNAAVKLTWTAQPHTSAYGIMRAESENGPYSWIASVGGTSYTDQGLKTGQTYYYKIYASALLDGTWYNGALSSPVPGEALRAPASVQVKSYEGNAFQISWEPVEGADLYRVYYADSRGGALTEAATVSGTEYLHRGFEEGDRVYYVIQSLCYVDGLWGGGGYTGYTEGVLKMPAPTGIKTGPGRGDYTVRISWDPVPKATMYGIMRADSEEGPYEWIGLSDSLEFTDVRHVLDGNLDTRCYYKVYATRRVNGGWDNGEMSDAVPGSVCGAPENLSVITQTASSMKLSWDPVPDATGYAVFRDAGQGYVLLGIISQTEYTDSDCILGGTYTYMIRSVANVNGYWGYGLYSKPVSAVLIPQTPAGLFAEPDWDTQAVNISWEAAPGASTYGILRAESEDGPYEWLGAVNSLSYRDTSCQAGKTYYYKVYGAALGTDGVWYNSANSGAAAAEAPRIKALGVDVSYYNGNIDWQQVADSGVSFAMIRIGYRRNADGVIIEDVCAAQNIRGALDAGLEVGVYFFSTAVNEAEAIEEAAWTVNYIKDYHITFPVAYDCEGYNDETSRMYQAGLTIDQRSWHASVFLTTVAGQGYTPMMYGSSYHLTNSWRIEHLEQNYQIWVAQWPSEVPVYPDEGSSSYGRTHKMWQYTDRGTVPGISGAVDLDVFYYE